MSTNVTLTGTLGRDPELRFTAKGKAVVTLSVVTSKSVLDESTNKWVNEEETWWRVTAWDKLAENIAETLLKGDPVIVVGRAFMDSYDGKDGEKRQSLAVNAYTVALELKRRSAAVNRVKRDGGAPAQSAAPAADQWDQAPF